MLKIKNPAWKGRVHTVRRRYEFIRRCNFILRRKMAGEHEKRTHLPSPMPGNSDEHGNRFQDVKEGFKAACRRAGIKDFHFHNLRHTFASHLVMAGVDLTTVNELLDHKTLTMTLRYAHLSPTHEVNTAKILDSTLSAKSTL